MIRRNIRPLNEGELRAGADDVRAPTRTLTFPGANSWSRMYREPRPGRDAVPTHAGRAEIEAFLQRYVGNGIQMEIEDILVNGPPWNPRAALVVHDWVARPDGPDLYANRAVLFIRTRWGKTSDHEDFEDTERSAAFDVVAAPDAARCISPSAAGVSLGSRPRRDAIQERSTMPELDLGPRRDPYGRVDPCDSRRAARRADTVSRLLARRPRRSRRRSRDGVHRGRDEAPGRGERGTSPGSATTGTSASPPRPWDPLAM